MEWLDSTGDATDMLLMADSAMGCDGVDADVDPCQEPRSNSRLRARSCSGDCSEGSRRVTGDIFRISWRRIDGITPCISDEFKLLSIVEL